MYRIGRKTRGYQQYSVSLEIPGLKEGKEIQAKVIEHTSNMQITYSMGSMYMHLTEQWPDRELSKALLTMTKLIDVNFRDVLSDAVVRGGLRQNALHEDGR